MAYSLLVIVLLILVACSAYVITLEEAPVPSFIIRLLENKLEARGTALSMKGIRITPSGRITITEPSFKSTDLDDLIAQADSISLKLNPSLLIFGKLNFTEAQVSNAKLLAPAILSPTGVTEIIADRLDLEIVERRDSLEIRFAKFQLENIRCFAKGTIDKDLLIQSRKKPAQNLTALLIKNLPQLWELEKNLDYIDLAEVQADFNAHSLEQRQVEITAVVPRFTLPGKANASKLRIRAKLQESGEVALELAATNANGPQGISLHQPRLSAVWNQLPSAEQWHPSFISASFDELEKDDQPLLSGLLAEAAILNQEIDYTGRFTFAEKALSLSGNYNLESKRSRVDLEGELGAGAPAIFATALNKTEIENVATIHESPHIELSSTLDESFKPLTARVRLDAGPITIKGARFDRSQAVAQLDGPQLSVRDLFLRSGKQNGWMSIGYNLETKKRRFLIDGLFDPATLNNWFEPWWAEFWNNFQFPEGGFHCLLDSQAIFLRPDTLRITGLGMSPNLGIRGESMDFLRTRMFILLHYFDLYDFDLRRPEGDAFGETQIYVARDPTDQKEKLAGLWINATSSIDPRIGPTVLYEIDKDIEDILEPYTFETPPTVKAVASTKRIQGEYRYEAELDIDMPHPFTFFDYPLDGVETKVLLENRVITIPDAKASLADGFVHAQADILDDDIDLKVDLRNANFGEALQATVKYFAVDDPSIAEEVDIEELTDYGGLIDMDFSGKGILGDALSYEGAGTYDIQKAELGKLQLFGLLSKVLEATPLRFSTLSFQNAVGTFSAHKTYLEYPDVRMTGSAARVTAGGKYDLETELLDFKAKLFPFRHSAMPVMAIVGVVLEPLSHALEVRLTGTLTDPKVSLFSGSSQKGN